MIIAATEAIGSMALAAAQTVVATLTGRDAGTCSDAELLADWQALETLRNTLAAVEHPILLEVERRGIPRQHGATNTAAFVRQLLRVTPSDANARVVAAHAAGPRQSLTGEPVAPEFPLVAAAQASGAISPAHAQIVARTIQQLPDTVIDQAPDLEAELVASAADCDPPALQKFAHSSGRVSGSGRPARRRCLPAAAPRPAYLSTGGRVRHRGDRCHRRTDGTTAHSAGPAGQATSGSGPV